MAGVAEAATCRQALNHKADFEFITNLNTFTEHNLKELQPVQLLDVLTINEKPKNKENLLEIIYQAFCYFPQGIWQGIKYQGNINVKHDLKIKSKEKIYGAFIFNSLMVRIREKKNTLNSQGLLLAVTHDPVIAIYHRFESDRFKKIVNLIRDYVIKDVGMVSLFEVKKEAATKISAHGLGHNKGLKHHAEPIDLMYARLLDGYPIKKEGFCNKCQRKLKKE
ncbi:hypothetical protein GWO13_08935 [Candidatus Bathyarchaeota archaeon]|nr:hypothetical protein [Candidatus Bathyarchaeota archaeon]